MPDWFPLDARLLVHGASALYVVAFLVRDQLALRAIVLVATAMFVAYYFIAFQEPLWTSIVWSLILGAANLLIMVQLLLSRTTFAMTEAQREFYAQFKSMTPGEFRQLLKIGEWRCSDEVLELTREGVPTTHLHFLLRGEATATKGERRLTIPTPAFIGEVSYLLCRGASATARAEPGTMAISWERSRLERLLRKQPAIRVALHGLMNTDMARKVALG